MPQSSHEGVESASSFISLRLLSFNMQAAIGMHQAHHWLTKSTGYVWASSQQPQLMQAIAELLSGYDIVALQEVDGGSWRSGHRAQLAALARMAGFSSQHQQLNRDFGKFGQFCNGFLCRHTPLTVDNYRLPGVPGRGVMLARFGDPAAPWVVVNAHLALGARIRRQQLDFVAELLTGIEHVVMMGDWNASRAEVLASNLGAREWHSATEQPSYPSWRPKRAIDHILVSATFASATVNVIPAKLSDHCPVEAELILPRHLY